MKKALALALSMSLILLTACSFSKDESSQNLSFEEKNVQATVKSKPTDNILLTLDESSYREVNFFLTGFSEVFYDPSLGFLSEAEEKVNFAYLNATIYSKSMTFYKDKCYGISAENVDSILNRFFGSTVPHETPQDSKYWTYKDGDFLLPALPGEPYPNFSIATNMSKRQDGNFDVSFNIYSENSASEGEVISDKSVLSLSDSEASAKYKYSGYGQAVLKPKVYNGKNTYELASYDVYYDFE